MPLRPGSSNKVISENISELTHHGSKDRPHDQIVAIALANARRHPKAAKGGSIADADTFSEVMPNHLGGLIDSAVGGRTDRLPFNVPADSFVIPADVVSSLGQGNTAAGGKLLMDIFGMPHGVSGGPYGVKAPGKRADGGGTGNSSVILAGGEFLVPSERVKSIGHGDMKKGHKHMRAFVERVRKEAIKWLKNAPKPKQ